MKLRTGIDYFAKKRGVETPVEFDLKKLVNPHMLLLGGSGVGKSFTLQRFVQQAISQDSSVRFVIYDVHGDMGMEGESCVRFSEIAPYGLNPLRIDSNPETGGVRNAIQTFIEVLETATRKLGDNQENVLRELLKDVYLNMGFDDKDPSTWTLSGSLSGVDAKSNRIYLDVPYKDKDKASALGARWDKSQSSWYVQSEQYQGDLLQWKVIEKQKRFPTLVDVYQYAKSLLEQMTLGSEQKAMKALAATNKAAQALQRKQFQYLKARRTMVGFVDDELEEQLELAKVKAVECYTEYVNSIKTGNELELTMKYHSVDTLRSVVTRLENLSSKGIFKAQTPPFDLNARILRYDLSALRSPEQKMFVFFHLQELFDTHKAAGIAPSMRTVAMVDELGMYTAGMSLDTDSIFTRIVKEARKFGLGLWTAAQSTDDVPKKLISSLAVKIILGIDETGWKHAIGSLMVDQKLMEFVAAKVTMAVQYKESGSLKTKWNWVSIPPKEDKIWDMRS